MLLCILAFVCALKMHLQVSSSIEKLRNGGGLVAITPTLNRNGNQTTNATTTAKKIQNNRNPKTAATAAAAAAAKRNQIKASIQTKMQAKNSPQVSLINSTKFTTLNTNVPFVYMVFKRVDYLQRAIESLNQSDYPKDRLPLIISHDGHVPEVVNYVDTVIKKDFNVIQLFHPYSCYEHPNTFPGNDTKLNQGYIGDWHGNTRSSWATCCKHHFTWMINQVFQMNNFTDKDNNHLHVDTFLFTEEDYLVAPNVYAAIIAGMNVMDNITDMVPGGFLGLGLDPTNSGKNLLNSNHTDAPWKADSFRTGPMTLNRSIFAKIKENVHAHYAYCTFDDYNWDWSMEHLTKKRYLPFTILMPGGKLVQHIGTIGGMHSKNIKNRTKTLQDEEFFSNKNTTLWTVNQRVLCNVTVVPPKKVLPGNGGWGHAADHAHCLQLFQW